MPPTPASPTTPACIVLIDAVADRLITQQLNSPDIPPAIEVVDVRAIDHRGRDIIEALRATRFTGGLVIISQSTAEDRVALLDAGADHVLDPREV